MYHSADPHRHDARARSAIAVASVALASLLTACGVVAAFAPPISVGDPLGVDGQTVHAVLQEGALQVQSLAHLDETRSFDLPDLDENLRGFSLSGFHADAGLADGITLRGPAGTGASAYPAHITLTHAVVEAELWDDVNGHVSFARDLDLSLGFARTTCSADGCNYAYDGTGDLGDALSVELTDRAKLKQLVSILILRDAETPNHGSFRVAVEFDADTSLAGYSAMFRLTSEGSKIRLGG